ncbi:MAG TPA: hypothetical protein ENG55_02105 [Candidatus Omnitrophica bacterium]|nr:hypothetical protein [Candidatus Omnitrophota bacterium]
MRRFLVLIFFIIFLSGCATSTSKKANLTTKDKNLLSSWMKAADLSYRVGDYRLSLEYYQRIIERYPDSESAQVARKEIKKIQKILRRAGETDF